MLFYLDALALAEAFITQNEAEALTVPERLDACYWAWLLAPELLLELWLLLDLEEEDEL